MIGRLYIVATPIGNLEDITLRAKRILGEVDIILAEDTRITRRLLDFLTTNDLSASRFRTRRLQAGQQPTTKLISYHQHSGVTKKIKIAESIIAGKNIALVTDAGTPGISDPGNELISFLVENIPDIKVVPIPGASAITASLSICGFNINKFVFLGFLPKKKRDKLFDWLKEGKISFAFYESPKRIIKTLNHLKEHFGGNKKVFIARELTKLHEMLYRGSVVQVQKMLKGNNIKGEIVVVVEL